MIAFMYVREMGHGDLHFTLQVFLAFLKFLQSVCVIFVLEKENVAGKTGRKWTLQGQGETLREPMRMAGKVLEGSGAGFVEEEGVRG